MTKELTEEQLASFQQFADMKNEPLHPDLVPYVTTTAGGLPLIGHPLIHDIMPINGYANMKYAEKTEALQKALAEEDWFTVIFLHEKPYRCEALIEYVVGTEEGTGEPMQVKGMSAEVRELVADVWRDSENIHQHIEQWGYMIGGWTPGEPPIFCDDEEGYAALPDLVTVWRGDVDDGRWSWTTQKKTALFFARRWEANVPLLSGIVRKDCIFGYLTGRNENEVMVHYEDVTCLREHEYEKRVIKS